MSWKFGTGANGEGELSLKVNQPAKKIRLWTAESDIRDMRRAKWTSRELEIQRDLADAHALLGAPSVKRSQRVVHQRGVVLVGEDSPR